MASRTMRWTFMLVFIGVVALAGCAAIQTEKTESTEQLLLVAGFDKKSADTAARQAHLKTLIQHKLVPYDLDGQTMYVYADAADNRLYIGDQVAFDRFLALAEKKQIAQLLAKQARGMGNPVTSWKVWGY